QRLAYFKAWKVILRRAPAPRQCTASTTQYTTVDKIKRRQGQKVTITNKENAPPTGGATDPKLRPKRAVKAVHRAGMNPTPLQQQPQNYQHQQTQADPEQNDASETRTTKKLRCDNFADIAEETTREKNAPSINPVGDNNQICTIIDSVNTTTTINSSPTYLPSTETSSNLNVQEPHMQDPVIPQTASISMHSPQHPEPDGNRVEESQDMENMELCISTPSTIRSRANQIEQWTSGATKIRGQQSRDHFDIKLWHYDRIVKALETKEGVEELAAYKFATQPLLCTHTPAVKQKFIHRGTTFFLTFTRANKYKPVHQLEYESEFKTCMQRYKEINNVAITDRQTRTQIHTKLRQKIAADYLISLDFNKTNTTTIAKIVQYSTTHGNDNKPILPDTVDEIKQILIAGKEDKTDIQEIELPITTHAQFAQTLKLLRDHFNFNGIPNHIINLSPLPAPSWEIFKL
ncbi:1271_t:CDS:2, partial [Gigaspora rosea]